MIKKFRTNKLDTFVDEKGRRKYRVCFYVSKILRQLYKLDDDIELSRIRYEIKLRPHTKELIIKFRKPNLKKGEEK